MKEMDIAMKISAVISITTEILAIRTADRDAAETIILDAAAEARVVHRVRRVRKDLEEFQVQWVQ